MYTKANGGLALEAGHGRRRLGAVEASCEQSVYNIA